MTTQRRMDGDLPRILGDIAAGPYPDYIDDVLSTTAQRRQRPAWTFPERWLPMETVAAQVTTTRFPMRTVGVLTLIAILVVTAVAVYVGTQQPPLPAPPYGLADNGRIAYAADGDIHVVGGPTERASVLIGGAEIDADPQFSRDGRLIAFSRRVDDRFHLMVANADGSSAVTVTSDPVGQISDIAFAPDGRSIAMITYSDLSRSLAIAATDGSSFRWIAIDGQARAPVFVPPTGESLVFVLSDPEAGGEALALLDLSTNEVEVLVPAVRTATFPGGPAPAPDGSLVAYSHWIPGPPERLARIFTIAPVAGSRPQLLPAPSGICCQGQPNWSNDGTRLAMGRWHLDDRKAVVVVDALKGGQGMEIEVDMADTVDLIWSPDDRFLLGVGPLTGDVRKSQFVVDVDQGERLPDTWFANSYPAWQRIGSGS